MKTPGTGISGPGAVASLLSAMYARLIPLGFVYRLVPEPAEQDAYLQEYGRRVVEMAPSIRRVWKREWEPQIRAACHWLQRDDYLSMDLPQLTTYLEHCMGGLLAPTDSPSSQLPPCSPAASPCALYV